MLSGPICGYISVFLLREISITFMNIRLYMSSEICSLATFMDTYPFICRDKYPSHYEYPLVICWVKYPTHSWISNSYLSSKISITFMNIQYLSVEWNILHIYGYPIVICRVKYPSHSWISHSYLSSEIYFTFMNTQ